MTGILDCILALDLNIGGITCQLWTLPSLSWQIGLT